MKDTQKPQTNPDYTVEKFEDEIILYTKTIAQAVYLNDTAYAVWMLCKEDLTIGQMIEYLETLYPDQAEQIREEVITALEILQSHNVIDLSHVE